MPGREYCHRTRNTDGKVGGSKHHGLLHRSWGNGHRGKLLHRWTKNHFLAGVSLCSLLPNPRDKALYPQGPTWVKGQRMSTRETLMEPAPRAVLGVGPAQGAVLPRRLQQCLVRWSGRSVFRKTEARVAYISVRHFNNADLPSSNTEVSDLRYQDSNRA